MQQHNNKLPVEPLLDPEFDDPLPSTINPDDLSMLVHGQNNMINGEYNNEMSR